MERATAMMNSFTLDRANARVAEINARGLAFDARTVQLNGYVGRADRPDLFWGYAVVYSQDGERRFTVWPDDEFTDGFKALFVIDGIGYWVAGFSQRSGSSLTLWPVTRVNKADGTAEAFLHEPTRRAYVMWANEI